MGKINYGGELAQRQNGLKGLTKKNTKVIQGLVNEEDGTFDHSKNRVYLVEFI